jgi:hypothetical protein
VVDDDDEEEEEEEKEEEEEEEEEEEKAGEEDNQEENDFDSEVVALKSPFNAGLYVRSRTAMMTASTGFTTFFTLAIKALKSTDGAEPIPNILRRACKGWDEDTKKFPIAFFSAPSISVIETRPSPSMSIKERKSLLLVDFEAVAVFIIAAAALAPADLVAVAAPE